MQKLFTKWWIAKEPNTIYPQKTIETLLCAKPYNSKHKLQKNRLGILRKLFRKVILLFILIKWFCATIFMHLKATHDIHRNPHLRRKHTQLQHWSNCFKKFEADYLWSKHKLVSFQFKQKHNICSMGKRLEVESFLPQSYRKPEQCDISNTNEFFVIAHGKSSYLRTLSCLPRLFSRPSTLV